MIRSSKLKITNANKGKFDVYSDFIFEYRRVCSILVDFYWETGLTFGNFCLDIKNEKLTFPTMLAVEFLPKFETSLTGRALKCLTTQVCGIINASIKKRNSDLYYRDFLIKLKKSIPVKLETRINTPLTKPRTENINPEINSICCDLQNVDSKYFNSFFCLKSFTNNERGFSIKIPIIFHRQFHKWNKVGTLLNSFCMLDDSIVVRFEVEEKVKSVGNVVGADQGLKTVVTLSNGVVTPEKDKDGYSLDTICNKLARKLKGSKAFKKSQDHRKNFIHWSINQLNFDNVKELRLEKITNINFGKSASRKMQSWTNTIIRDKLKSFAQLHEVHVVEQDPVYKSQRCCECGNVRKSNRKGKEYNCKNCGNIIDSDLNSAKNQILDLIPIPFDFRGKKLNLGGGFFWKPSGLFNFLGEELTVPLSNNELISE